MTANEPGPLPAKPQRPPRPLSSLGLLRVALSNSLAACDEELFDEPIVERRYVWGRFLSVSDPEGIRHVMHDNVDNYPRIGAIRRIFAFGSGTGMLAAEGEVWRRHRRILNPTLDHRAVLADLPAIAELAEELAERLTQVPREQVLDIGETFAHLITAVTGRVFAGGVREIDPVMYRLGQYPGKYSVFDFLAAPACLRVRARRHGGAGTAEAYRPLIARLLAMRRRADYDGPRDLLWRAAHAADPQTGAMLSAEELHDEILTLGATAATPIRVFPWLWYLLALHPAAEARLHAELDAVLGGRAPTTDDLQRLVYLRRVIDETLRLYPPAPTMLRTAAGDDVICGRKVRRGTVVGVLPWVIHRHRALWHEPDRFDPERFTPDAVAARSRYAYLPFAIGPRVCIGASLAIVEIVIAAAVIAQRCRFRLAPGRRIEPTAWTNLHPRGGIWMHIEPRR